MNIVSKFSSLNACGCDPGGPNTIKSVTLTTRTRNAGARRRSNAAAATTSKVTSTPIPTTTLDAFTSAANHCHFMRRGQHSHIRINAIIHTRKLPDGRTSDAMLRRKVISSMISQYPTRVSESSLRLLPRVITTQVSAACCPPSDSRNSWHEDSEQWWRGNNWHQVEGRLAQGSV